MVVQLDSMLRGQVVSELGVICQAENRVKGLLQAQVPGRSAEALLLTYARASQSHSSAAVLYSAR